MFASESRVVRRFVGRLDRGEELVGSLAQFCEQERVRGAWLRAVGILEWVDLVEWNADRESWSPPRRVVGPVAMVSMEGTVSIRNGPLAVQVSAVLTRQSDIGISAFGGAVAAASVLSVEFAMESFDDVRLEREHDPSTGLLLLKGLATRGVMARGTSAREDSSPRSAAAARPRDEARAVTLRVDPAAGAAPPEVRPPSPTPSPGAGTVSWAQAAAASDLAAASAPASGSRWAAPAGAHLIPPVGGTTSAGHGTNEVEFVLAKGDWIDHRQFGLCRVDGDDEDGGLRIRLPSGVRKVIKLDVLEVLSPRLEGERKIFPLRPRRR